jgi:hypothetical protein
MEGSSFFQRLKQGLTKNRESWVQKIAAVVQNRRWDETSIADMERVSSPHVSGVKATQELMETCVSDRPVAPRIWAGNVADIAGGPGGHAARSAAPKSLRYQRAHGW